MNSSIVNIVDLCDEILLAILNKLNSIDVLYSLIGVNRKLDGLVRDITFTQSLDLVGISSNEHNDSRTKSILDRFCFSIIPRIQHNVQCLTLDQLSVHRVISIGNYPKLHKLTLVDLKYTTAARIFDEDSPFTSLYKHQVSQLVVTINDNGRDDEWLRRFSTYLFVDICTIFTNLTHFGFDLKDRCLYPLSVLHDFSPTICYSSSIVHLNVKMQIFDDCFCVLEGNLSQLHTFIVYANRIRYTSMRISNTKTLSNLKCFSLSSFWPTLEYDNQILPLLRQMSQLEKLTLSLQIRDRISFIDGIHLDNHIISKMPYLQRFIFDIVTEYVIIDEELLPTSDDIRRGLLQIGYNAGCYMDYVFNGTGRCHIYSLPFTMERIQEITIKFPGDVFMHVRHVVVYDFFRPIEHDFFVLISQSFPLLKHLGVYSIVEQKKKRSNKLDEYEQTFSIVEFSHLMTLDLNTSHVDYAEQFLLDSNTRLPRLSTLYIDYGKLAKVTEDFTCDTDHANCKKLKNIIFVGPRRIIQRKFFNYFPFAVNSFLS